MQVRVTYATVGKPHEMLNPYGDLQLTVEGDIETVCNWLDENIEAGRCALSDDKYVQGAARPRILKALQEADTLDLDAGLLAIERLVPAPIVTRHLIAFCEQTHPHGQGFAAGDHISKECYTLILSDVDKELVEVLVARINAKFKVANDVACEEWHAAHPDEIECLSEGDEFVGLRWVEHESHESSYTGDSDGSAEVIKRLMAWALAD